MKKDQFVRSFAEAKGISIKEAREQVNGVFGHVVTVAPTLAHGEKLSITGIVEFTATDVPARVGRNPQTGEQVQVAATRKIKASVKATLKDAVKG